MQEHGAEAGSPSANDAPTPPANIKRTMLRLKHSAVRAYGWSLHDIDETDIDSLFAFALFKPDEYTDPDTRQFGSETATRYKGQGAPSWL